MPSENPFASPEELSEKDLKTGCWRDKDQLVATCSKSSSLGKTIVDSLPQKCFVCGEPAKEHTARHYSIFTSGSFSLSPEFFIEVPLCREHYRAWTLENRSFNPISFFLYLVLMILVLGVISFILGLGLIPMGFLFLLLSYIGMRFAMRKRNKDQYLEIEVTDFHPPYVWIKDYPESILKTLPPWDRDSHLE